jgi:hypothetical protein
MSRPQFVGLIPCFLWFCTRFLRARKFDLPKAKAMLLSQEQWRQDFGVDEIVKCVIPQTGPSSLDGGGTLQEL